MFIVFDQVRRFSGGRDASYKHLFTQVLATLISREFSPGLRSLVISRRYGGFHIVPAGFPFTENFAISATQSTSIYALTFGAA